MTVQADPDEVSRSRRDRHLFGAGAKRILALDGGGVRGAISVAFLERMEVLLAEHGGDDVRLGDWFDLVGGTSTGAIIAGALALGYDTANLRHFYLNLAPSIFKPPPWRVPWLQSKFDAHALSAEIERVVGARTLDSEDLITGFCLVTKRADTGSPWIIANNPRAPYWETPADRRHLGNRFYQLANLVRASTAAPSYFDPELIPIVQGEPNGLFIDGGVSPHNNPSLIMFLMATLKPYGMCWATGPEQLTIVSVGTGTYRHRLQYKPHGPLREVTLAIHALTSLIDDSETLVLTLMQWLGECPAPWPINREIGTLAGEGLTSGPLFKFVRYDVRLETDWLRPPNLDEAISERDVERLRTMDDPGIIQLAYEIGQQAAVRQVRPEHWGLPGGER